MSQLIVIKFDDMEQAGKVREALRAQEKQGLIKMEDAEVIVRDADGKIEKKGETDRGVKIGAVGGGMLGLLPDRRAAPRRRGRGLDRQIAWAGCR
jgi:uncharacterized membrane protein